MIKNKHVVSNFVETNKKDFETLRSGIANGNTDIYKSHKLSKDFVHIVFTDDLKKTELIIVPVRGFKHVGLAQLQPRKAAKRKWKTERTINDNSRDNNSAHTVH